MSRFKEKLKSIWHIITDREYIVFTVTVRDGSIKRIASLISDNVTDTTLKSAMRVLNKERKTKRPYKHGKNY